LFETGVAFNRQLTYVEWEGLFNASLARLIDSEHGETRSHWQMGDVVHYGEEKLGEDHAQAIDPTHYKIETIRGAVWVASRVPVANRHPALAFGAYKYIAKLDHPKQKEVVQKAVDEKMTVLAVKKLVVEISGKRKRKARKASEAPPVRMVDITGKYLTAVKELLDEMPLKDWQEDALATVKETFDSMVLNVAEAFGWKSRRALLASGPDEQA